MEMMKICIIDVVLNEVMSIYIFLPPLSSCVCLIKVLNVSVPISRDKNKNTYFIRLLEGVNEYIKRTGLPNWLSGKEPAYQCSRRGFNLWIRNIPWRRKWQPTPVFFPGKSHGQRSLVGYSPWGQKRVGRD